MPTALLEESCKRVGLAGVMFAALWLWALLVNDVFRPMAGIRPDSGIAGAWPLPGNIIAPIGLVVSLAIVFAASRLHNKPNLLANIGLSFEVFGAFLVGLLNQWHPQLIPGNVSWICVIILVYPTIAPNTVRKTLLVALLAASMDPFALWLTVLRTGELPGTVVNAVMSFLPNYICALLAVVPAHVISGLGREVTKARELGSYRLGDILGQGGMGQVHLATHQMLARPAAIKLIRPDAIGAGRSAAANIVIERFKREAQAAAALRSPHTIELYDFGVSEDGALYYVMELLDGLDLESLVENFGPVSSERAVHFLRQACMSLGEAHECGMIHRDVKPSNLFATRLGLTVDFLKILDFGLVKNIGPKPDSNLTAPQVAPGTPAFMAPEIAMGEQADLRADVYALGCVSYWLLTGQPVFEGRNPAEIMNKHVKDAPVPPSLRTEIEISSEFDALVLACLSKKPADRPANGLELGELLGRLDECGQWTQERARRWWDINVPTCSHGEISQHVSTLAPALARD